MVLEADHEKKLVKAVKAEKGLCIKLPASLYRGIPDRMILLSGGRLLFMELKKIGGKKPSVHQLRFRKILLQLGFHHDIITGEAELKEWMNEHLTETY